MSCGELGCERDVQLLRAALVRIEGVVKLRCISDRALGRPDDRMLLDILYVIERNLA